MARDRRETLYKIRDLQMKVRDLENGIKEEIFANKLIDLVKVDWLKIAKMERERV